MSDDRRSESRPYAPLKGTEAAVAKQIEAQKAHDAKYLTLEEFTEQRRAEKVEELRQLVDNGKISGREMFDRLQRFEADPDTFEKISKDYEARQRRLEKEEPKREGSAVEMTDARAERMQRLKEAAAQVTRERESGEPVRDVSGQDRGGRSR